LRDDNGFAEAIISGAKGTYTNITQIITGMGQQLSNGERMPQQFRGRTLPHTHRSRVEFIDPFTDDIIEYMTNMFKNRGLVVNSLTNGLEPREFWFHAVGGREGIISTAVKTSITGYVSRRLVKKMEDFKMTYYNTVTNSKGNIYSFEYNNGFDPSRAVLVNGSSQFCNVKVIIDRLNKQYENKQEISKKKK
jgi:DNA-directed RNA polymerase II subunit RPB1